MEMFISNDLGEKIGVKIDPAPECIAKMYAVGLDCMNHTVLEGLGQGGNAGIAYRPAADIANLFPPLLDVALNHMNSKYSEEEIQELRTTIVTYLSDFAHTTNELTYAAKLHNEIDSIKNKHSDLYADFTKTFTYCAMVAYSLAVKTKLKGDTVANINATVYPMFALLSIFEDLSEETRNNIVKEMTEKHLWGL